MADRFKRVAYQCQWCGQDLHEVEDERSMAPRGIYNDWDGRQYCSRYCAREGQRFYREELAAV
jgi:hypothetical protein